MRPGQERDELRRLVLHDEVAVQRLERLDCPTVASRQHERVGSVAAGPDLDAELLEPRPQPVGAGANAVGAERQRGYSSWATVVTRLCVTGLLPAFVAAGLAAVRRPGLPTSFAFLLPAPYLFYVLGMRDAFATTFVMMLCLVFWSFPIALLLAESPRLAVGRRLHAVFALYLIAAPLNAWVNLWRDTRPFRIVPGCSTTPVDRSAPRITESCLKD